MPQAEPNSWRSRVFPNGEHVLLLALLVEIAIFSVLAPNFFSSANFFEVVRFSVELGLLALAETSVIITGGIDLSVGSMMGLAAVVFGAAWHDLHFSLLSAAAAALLAGLAGGSLNALLVTRLDLPPLIVTLGTYSMFRGIAEGITHGAVNYTDFPSRFLFLGQGYFWGVIPAQLPVFVLVFAGYFVLVHRSVDGHGRSIRLVSRRAERAMRAFRFAGESRLFTFSPAWFRVSPRLFTWLILARLGPTRGPDMSWTRSRRLF